MRLNLILSRPDIVTIVRATNKLCLLINIMFIIMFVITYAYFLIFLSVYCNVMLAIIKKEKEDEN